MDVFLTDLHFQHLRNLTITIQKQIVFWKLHGMFTFNLGSFQLKVKVNVIYILTEDIS